MMLKEIVLKRKMKILKKGLAFVLSLGILLSAMPLGNYGLSGVTNAYADEVMATSSNAILADGELENDLHSEEVSGEAYSDTMYQDELVFSGINTKIFVPGEEIDLLDGVGASIPGYDYHITVEVAEIKDSLGNEYPAFPIFEVPETENVTYSVKYVAYISKEELRSIGNVLVATQSNATSERGFAPLFRARSTSLSPNSNLPVGGVIHLAAITIGTGNKRLRVDNIRTGDERSYTDLTISAKVTVDATTSTVDLPGAYAILRVPVKHLDQRIISNATGEIAGLRINASSLIDNTRIRYEREVIGGEEYIFAKIYFRDLKRTTIGDFPYNIKFSDDRKTPADYLLQTELDFYDESDQLIGSSPKADFRPLYDPQVITKYAVSNNHENYSTPNQIMYGGRTVNNIIQESTAKEITFMYNMQTKDPTNSFSRPSRIYRQRLLEKIVLEDTLPTYTNHLTNEPNFPAFFDPALNPGWVVSERDASNRPTKVKKEVISLSDDNINGGADAVLKDSIRLKLKFPGLKTNEARVDGLTVSANQTNNINAELIPYNATATELADPTLKVHDDLIFNIEPTESGRGLIGKKHLEQTIPIENGFMHNESKGANFLVTFHNKMPSPAKELSIYDFKADERTYYRHIEFRSNDGDVGGDKVKEIWGVDASKNRVARIYSRDDGPALPPAFGVDPYEENVRTQKLPLDKMVTDQVAAMVRDVENGVIEDTATTPVPRTYEGIEVVYDGEIPPFEAASFRIQLGFRDPYHVRTNNPDNLIENSAGYKVKFEENSTTRQLEGEIERNRTRLVPLEESLDFKKHTVANNTGNTGEQPVYRINFFFTKMSNSRVLRNPKLIEVLPRGMEYVGIHSTTGTNIRDTETIRNYKDTGRTAVILTLDDIVVENFPIVNRNKFIQVQVRGKIAEGMFPDPNGNLPANQNQVFFMADNFYPLNSAVRVPTAETPNAAGETFGLLDDIYDIDNNPRTTKVLGATSKTKVNVGGQVVSYKQIRNKDGVWVPSGNTALNAVDGIVTRFDEEFEYRIMTENMTSGSYGGYAIYDILPYIGDQPYVGSTTQRGSVFRNRLQNKLVPSDPGDYIIKYSTNPNPNPNPLLAMEDAAMDWKIDTQITNWEDVTAIKINLAPGKVLPHSSIVRFTAPMKAPLLPSDPNVAKNMFLRKAINLFSVSYNYDMPNKSFAASNSVFNQLGRNVIVEKEWSGTNLNVPITVQLKQNGNNFSSDLYPNGQIILDSSNNYQSMFERIPVSDGSGNRHNYTLEEIGVGTGNLANYEAVISGDDEQGFLVRNIEKKDLKIKKIWNDAGFEAAARPSSIQIQLKRSIPGGVEENVDAAVTMTGTTDTWEYIYSALPVSDDNGNPYTYTIAELDSPALRNYGAAVVNVVSDTEQTITNSIVLRDLPVKKEWRNDAGTGTRPSALMVKVMQGSTEVAQANLGGSGDVWTHTFQNLLRYHQDGTEIMYTVTEEAVGLNNYLQSPPVREADGSITLVNTFVPFAVRAIVNWVDDNNSLETRPNGVKITLQRSVDGVNFVDVPGEVDRELDASNNFMHDYQNVAKYSPANEEYTYRIVQADHLNLRNYPDDSAHRVYTSDTTGNVKEFRVTNIYHTTSVQGRKIWDEQGRDYTRPNSLSIQLFRNNDTSSPYRTKAVTVLDADVTNQNRWFYVFNDLPVYDQNGDAYTYSVAEEQVPDFYMAVVNGYDITNTYPRDTEIKVKKIWDHGVLPQRFQATSATFELLRDNVVFETVTLNAVDSATHHWQHTFFVGESNARGHSFTVREADVPNYKAEYENTGINETTITNTYSPVPVEVKLDGIKNVSGKYIPDDAKFKFVLEPLNGAIMPNGQSGSMEIERSRGAFEFDAIRYTFPGEFKYRISEINTGADGFTYDTSVYDVEVNVEQEIQGLVANVKYFKNGVRVDTMEFNNVYTPPLGDLVFWNHVRGRHKIRNNDFVVKVKFEDDGVFEYTGAENGSFSREIEFTVKRHRKITIKDIPVGMKYTIELITSNGQYTDNPLNEGKIVKGINEVKIVHYEIPDRSSRVLRSGGGTRAGGGQSTKLNSNTVNDKVNDIDATNEPAEHPTTQPIEQSMPNVVGKTTAKSNAEQIIRSVKRMIPRTGDDAKLAIFGGILIIALGGFAFVGLRRRKDEKEEK